MKLRLVVECGTHRAEDVEELDDEQLAPLTEDERETVFDEMLKDHIGNSINAFWEILEDE